MNGLELTPTPPTAVRTTVARRVLVTVSTALMCAGVGVLTAVLWVLVAPRPFYLVGADGRASAAERGLTSVVGADAWFAGLALLGGLIIGLVVWWRFRPLGWPVVLVALGGSVLAGLVCWRLGQHLGYHDFTAQLATAQPGDQVQTDLELRARSALLAWPLAAVLPTLLAASLGREELPAPRPPADPAA